MASRWGWALAALALAGCATLPLAPPRSTSAMSRLPGWEAEDHVAAFNLVRRGCLDQPAVARPGICGRIIAMPTPSEGAAKAFLEAAFRPEPIAGEGLLTAYYSPTYEARGRPDAVFDTPVRAPSGTSADLWVRSDIEASAPPQSTAWMRPEDLFFLQIQGSGVLLFDDGARRRAVFAGSNGRPYVAISKSMIASGLFGPARASAGTLHDWLAAHRGPEADAVMNRDPRYIFFRLAPDDGSEPLGAAGAPMIAGRSLAIDPNFHRYFELFWIDADAPTLDGARPAYQRLALALDRGAAIKGDVRADLYTGRGPDAGVEAGGVRHDLRLFRIVPIEGRWP